MEKKLIAFNGYSIHMDTIKDILYQKKIIKKIKIKRQIYYFYQEIKKIYQKRQIYII